MNKKPIVLAFSGGCYSGKTTTILQAQILLEKEGLKVFYFKENARKWLNTTSIDKLRSNPIAYVNFEYDVISERMAFESKVVAGDYNAYDVILIDRAMTDNLMYLTLYTDLVHLQERDLIQRAASFEKYCYIHRRLYEHMHAVSFDCLYNMLIEFEPLKSPCRDVINRPDRIDDLKYVEYTAVNTLNWFFLSMHPQVIRQHVTDSNRATFAESLISTLKTIYSL